MSIASIIPLLSAILAFYLGLLVFFKGQKNRINTTFAGFAFVVTIWMLGTFMMFINKENIDKIIFWDKFVYAGVVFIPVIMLHFGLAITKNYSKKLKYFLYVGYPLSLFFLVLIPTSVFIDGAFIYEWGAHTKAKLFHHLFLIYFTTYIVSWFFIVYKYFKKPNSPFEKEKIKYCFIAFFILASLGPLGYLPAYGISIYPFSYISGIIFVVIMAYAIIKHRLMDIKLVMRKYTVYLLSLVTILLPILFLKYELTKYFTNFSIWIDFIILILGISLYPFVKNYYFRLANKYFFSSLYDSREVISDISNNLRTTLNINKIYEFIFEALSGSLHITKFGVLSYNEKTKKYIVKYNQNFQINGQKIFDGNIQLHKKFVDNNQAIVVEEVKNTYYNKKTKTTIDLLRKLNAEILAPLNVKDKTVGLLVLGPKESGDLYNEEDLQLLEIIGAQAATAIENALLYEETKDFNTKLKREVEKTTKELRDANEKLIQLDKAKSEFISIASHQLRTPLTVIKGYISMMVEGDFGELKVRQQENLEKVYESNERLIQLVENLLNISRIESGRLQFTFENMHLEDVVDSVVEELEGSAKKKGLKFTYKKPKKLLPKLKLDDEKIRQVVMNLIDNAIKYTKKGSITVSLQKQKKEIFFCVSDSGMGIDKKDLPNLFKKFSRGEGTNIVHTEGTGLGLYVAKQMINAHKGKVWAESSGPQKGSRFCFIIPIKK